MKKLTILCVASDKDGTLEALRELGLVHVAHVQPPEGEDLDRARKHFTYLRRALEVLPKHPGTEPSGKSADEVVEEIWALIHEKKDLEELLEGLKHEHARIEPFGSFEPSSIEALAEKGISLRLYQARPKYRIEPVEGVVFHVLRRDRNGTFFVAVGRGEFDVDAEEVAIPESSLQDVLGRIRETEKGLAWNQEEMAKHAGDRAVVAASVEAAEDKVRYMETRNGMGSTEPMAYLRGFCPEDAVERIRQAGMEQGWGLVIEDPAEDEQVPTLIRTPKWVSPVKAVLDAIGILPGYDEVDVSACFLVFFSLFFGMLVGDAAYGLIFLGLTIWARKKFSKLPRRAVALLYITSIATIIWGAVTGTWFGAASLPAPLQGLQIKWLTDEQHIMQLCFFIGAVHLTIAHGWLAWLRRRSFRALAQLGWIATTWMAYFLALELVLGLDHKSFTWPVIGVGALFIVLFMTPVKKLKSEWFGHAMLPLNLISNFVDVVSYVRLFAVGAATVAVASAFNEMALSGVSGVVSGVVAAFVLFLGHTLNIAMAIMGVMVHGIRLNTLEFSGHMGIEWKGFAYRPFEKERNGEGDVVKQAG